MSENEKDKEVWGVYQGKKQITKGSYEHCTAEMQRRWEEKNRRIADMNAQRQRAWEERGARDEDRDRC